jgi:hypothetical protein
MVMMHVVMVVMMMHPLRVGGGDARGGNGDGQSNNGK